MSINKPHFNKKLLWIAFAGLLLSTTGFAQKKTSKNDSKMATDSKMNGTAITLGGKPAHTVGKLPAVGTQVKPFELTGVDMKEKTFEDYKGKYVIMNIFPSVNTGVCSKSVRKFNEDAAGLANTTVLCISKDLPFAQKQFCGAEGINNVVMLSDFRSNFGTNYGLQIADGGMRGLLSRVVIVVDPKGKIVYEQQVPEIGQEPDYAAAIAAVK